MKVQSRSLPECGAALESHPTTTKIMQRQASKVSQMWRLIRKLVWPHRERLLAVVVLPSFLLATLPRTTCICGDGHREPNCNMPACLAAREGHATGGGCGCACCQAEASKPCCRKVKQCREESDQFPETGWAAKTSNCCQPIIES